MADQYANLKASELRTLLKSKHNNEPPKAMLKSQMLTLLLELDAAAGTGAPAAASAAAPAKPVAAAPVPTEAKEEAKPSAKKSATTAKAKTSAATTSQPAPAAEKPAAAASAKSSGASVTAKAVSAKPAPAKTPVKATAAVKVESPPDSSSSAPGASSATIGSDSPSSGNNPLSAERLAARAKRFGITEEQQKLLDRASRFGTDAPPKDKYTKRAEQAAKKEERDAKRSADLKAFNARATRFGLPLKVDHSAENEKKRARAERFSKDKHVTEAKKPKLEETS